MAFSLDFHIGVSKQGSVLSLPHPVFCEAPSRMWVRIFQRNVCCLPAQMVISRARASSRSVLLSLLGLLKFLQNYFEAHF